MFGWLPAVGIRLIESYLDSVLERLFLSYHFGLPLSEATPGFTMLHCTLDEGSSGCGESTNKH